MEAGRELDRLIGERIMGYTAHSGKGWYGWPGKTVWVLRDRMGKVVEPDSVESTPYDFSETGVWECCCPYFSTSLDDAALLIGRMRQHQQYRTLQLIAYPYNRTYATFVQHPGEHDDWCEANGEHATPLAICLAALEACPEGEDVWLPAEMFADVEG